MPNPSIHWTAFGSLLIVAVIHALPLAGAAGASRYNSALAAVVQVDIVALVLLVAGAATHGFLCSNT